MLRPGPRSYAPRVPSVELHDSVENLYAVFANHQLNLNVDGCEHCISLDEREQLWSTPLRSLNAQDLGLVEANILLTWGQVSDLKYFLPRLLDHMVSDEFYSSGVSILNRVGMAKFSSWPEQERQAVCRFLSAWWVFTLQQNVTLNHFLAEDALCAIAQVEDDLMHYLVTWEIQPNILADLHVMDMFRLLWSDDVQDLMFGNYWEGRREQAHQLHVWLVRSETLIRVRRASLLVEDDVYQIELRRVANNLEQLLQE